MKFRPYRISTQFLRKPGLIPNTKGNAGMRVVNRSAIGIIINGTTIEPLGGTWENLPQVGDVDLTEYTIQAQGSVEFEVITKFYIDTPNEYLRS